MLNGIALRCDSPVSTDHLNDPAQSGGEALRRDIAAVIDRICALNSRNPSRRTASAIARYISDHLGDYDMSLNRVADAFSISEKQVSRIIKDATGVSYKEYITVLRIARACAMLAGGNESINAVAESVGFANVSYFIRLFRDETGYTPANYKHVMNETDRRE